MTPHPPGALAPDGEAEPHGRLGAVGPPLAVAALAACVGAWLATRVAPTFDELYTLSYLRLHRATDLWHAYRSVQDAAPVAWYYVAWATDRVVGDDLWAARLPAVLGWAGMAAGIAATLRHRGPAAAIAGGMVPSATLLVVHGATGRTYGLTGCCLAWAAFAWTRSASDQRRRWVVVLAATMAGATALHLAAGAAGVCAVAVAEVVVRRGRPRASVLTALVVGALPGLAGLPLALGSTSWNGQDLPPTATSVELARWYPSVLRPLAPVVVVGLVVLAMAWRSRRRAGRGGRAAAPAAARRGAPVGDPVLVVGMTLLLLTPPLLVVAMAATTGAFFQRYAIGALVGLGLLVGSFVAMVPRSARVALCAAVGLSVVAATWFTDHRSGRLSDVLAIEAVLRLDRSDGPLVVAGPADLETLLLGTSPRTHERLVLAGRPIFAGQSRRHVEVHRLMDDAGRAGRPVAVVAEPDEVGALLAIHPGWTASTLAQLRQQDPERPRTLEHVLLRPPAERRDGRARGAAGD